MKTMGMEKNKKKAVRIFKICTWLIAFAMEMFLVTGCSSDYKSDDGSVDVNLNADVNVNGKNIEGVKAGEMEGSDTAEVTDTDSAEKIDIICTSYAAYDWIQNIIGGHADKFALFKFASSEL